MGETIQTNLISSLQPPAASRPEGSASASGTDLPVLTRADCWTGMVKLYATDAMPKPCTARCSLYGQVSGSADGPGLGCHLVTRITGEGSRGAHEGVIVTLWSVLLVELWLDVASSLGGMGWIR
jgi:hypothetical protein